MKNIKPIVSRLRGLQRELTRLGPIMRGSVVRLGPYKKIWFSLNKDKKTRLVYLGAAREKAAKLCSDNYKKLRAIVDEMTVLNMDLLHQHLEPDKCLKNRKKSSAG